MNRERYELALDEFDDMISDYRRTHRIGLRDKELIQWFKSLLLRIYGKMDTTKKGK